MKQLFYLLLAATAFTSYAQTPLIAHKSHSGISSSYFIDPSSNFGEIQIPMERQPLPVPTENFIYLSDTTIVLEILDPNQTVLKREVLSNKMRYSVLLFEAKYKDSIQKQKLEEYNRQMEQEQQMEEQNNIENQPIQAPKSKKKKKGELLLLSLLVGGGLFGFIVLYKRLIYRTAV